VVVALEVKRKRDGRESVGGKEAVDGKGAHPAVDVSASYAAEGEDRYRQSCENA